MNTPRSAHPSIEEYSDYYNSLSIVDFSSNASLVYQLPWGNRTLGGVSSVTRRLEKLAYVPGVAGLKNDLNFFTK